MKLARTSGTLGLVALAIFASPFALADDTGWYVGGDIGKTRATIDDPRITSGLLGSGFTTTSIVDDDRDKGYKLFGGYQFSKHFAVEGGYFDLGRFGFVATTVPAGTLSGDIKLKGLNLDLVGTLPFSSKFSAFGRVGVNYAQARDTFSGTGMVSVINPNPIQRGANLKAGLGLQFAFTEALAMRIEAERYRINDAVGNKGDIDMVSVGLIYRFGGKTPPPVARAPEPLPVYVAAAPEPVAAPAPAPATVPVSAKVTFSAETLFDFDKSVVKPEGRAALDDLMNKLQDMNAEVMITVGHTDSVGTDDDNQKLSVRRAEAVKAYLISKGIDTSRICTEGKGESQPIADNKSAAGRTRNRRVTVEVVGSRTAMN